MLGVDGIRIFLLDLKSLSRISGPTGDVPENIGYCSVGIGVNLSVDESWDGLREDKLLGDGRYGGGCSMSVMLSGSETAGDM